MLFGNGKAKSHKKNKGKRKSRRLGGVQGGAAENCANSPFVKILEAEIFKNPDQQVSRVSVRVLRVDFTWIAFLSNNNNHVSIES